MLACVATALTACGIETKEEWQTITFTEPLQQRLPLAVLKLRIFFDKGVFYNVATALTACGIETRTKWGQIKLLSGIALQQRLPLAVLKPIIKNCNG